MSLATNVPYRCPKCGDLKSFSSLRELKMHLDAEHSFRTSRAPHERQRSRVFAPLSKQKYSSRRERPARLSPLTLSFQEDASALEERLKTAKEAENSHKRVRPDGHHPLNDTITMLSRDVMQARQNQWNTADALYQSQDVLEGLQVSADKQNRQQTMSIAQLKNDLDHKEKTLSKVSKDMENLTRERIKLDAEKIALAQRMEESTGKVTNLESLMREKTEMLKQKEREYSELMKFLEGAAKKEALAREKLEDFINSILERAEKAEGELQQIKTQMNAPPVPPDVLSYLAHTRPTKSSQQFTNGAPPRSPATQQFSSGAGLRTPTAQQFRDGSGLRTPIAQQFTDGSGLRTPTAQPFTDGSGLRTPTAQQFTNGAGSRSPVPQHQLNAARTRSPIVSQFTNGANVRSPLVMPQQSAGPVKREPMAVQPGYHGQGVPTYTVYAAQHDPSILSTQTLQPEYGKQHMHRKPRTSKGSPSQSVRSRDSGIPEDMLQGEKYKAVSRSPHYNTGRHDYYKYEDESDYDEYGGANIYGNEEDYSMSQSESPNLAMLGNVSDSPNEFYHSSDEGIPDYYLDSDGILWDETVLSNGVGMPERAGLHRTSPSGSESGGQVIQSSNPADIYANTIKARTSYSSSSKPPFQGQSRSRKNPHNSAPQKESGLRATSPNTNKYEANSDMELVSKDSKPYSKEEYINSVKHSAKSHPNTSNKDSTDGGSIKSKERLNTKSVRGKHSKDDLPRQNSSSSGETIAPKSPSSQSSGNIIVAKADVHVNATPSDSDTIKSEKKPVPTKRTNKLEKTEAILTQTDETTTNRSFPRNKEKSEHVSQKEEAVPKFNSLPIAKEQKKSLKSNNTPLTSESTDQSSGTIKPKPIKKQASVGKISSTDRPPKPSEQQSSLSSHSPDDSQTGSEAGKATSSSVRTSFDSEDKPPHKQLQSKVSRELSINVPGDSIHSVSPIRIQMEDLQMMTDVEEEIMLHDTGVGPSGPQASTRVEEIKRRRLILLCIFLYLDTKTLSQLSLVCKEWKVVSRHPALWRRVRLRNARISSQYLITISKWCIQLQSLTLEGLKPRRKRKEESDEDYAKNTRGALEQGLETLLTVSQNSLISLRIANCDNILSERCLWEVSCYSRLLQRLCYISGTDPLGPEVMWNMGAGCRDIVTLIVPPGIPNKKPGRFNNKCVQLIGQLYPELKVLSIGGPEVDERGLLSLVKQCQRLQVLELDHMKEISEETAQSLCDTGLKDLQTLEFTNTPVKPKAVHLFSKHCRRLRRINVRVAISDYFEDTLRKENVDYFKNVVERFNSLKKRSNLASVLRIKTDAEGKERLRST